MLRRALWQAARLIKGVRGHPEGGQVRFLVTLQIEATRRVVSRLKEGGLEKAATELIEVERPDEESVGKLLSSVRTLTWAALRPELRELLTNLKLLDWVVRATNAGLEFGDGQPVTLTALVDRLWERWVEEDGSAYERSGLLMKIGDLEAASLADGVPRKNLQYQEQEVLSSLVTADLVRVRDERVRFAHDLLGDWSRLRLLVGEEPTASPDDRKRAASPRWHRAVRLFGQRLLEQGAGSDNGYIQIYFASGMFSPWGLLPRKKPLLVPIDGSAALGSVLSLAVDQDRELLAASDFFNNQISVWDTNKSVLKVGPFKPDGARGGGPAITRALGWADGRLLAGTGRLRAMLERGSSVDRVRVRRRGGRHLSRRIAHGQWAAVGTDEGTIMIWPTASPEQRQQKNKEGKIVGIGFVGPDRVYCCNAEGRISGLPFG